MTFHLHVFVAHRDLRNLSLPANGKWGKTVFLPSAQAGRGGDDDYWTEDSNTNKTKLAAQGVSTRGATETPRRRESKPQGTKFC